MPALRLCLLSDKMTRAGTGPHAWRITANYFTSQGLVNRARGLALLVSIFPEKAVHFWRPRLSQKLATHQAKESASELPLGELTCTTRIYDFIFQTEEILASQHLQIFHPRNQETLIY